MKDRLDVEVNVGDLVVYGVRAGSKGARGQLRIGHILEVNSRVVRVDTDYTQLESKSITKCSPKFAAMFMDNSIYNI